MILRKVIHKKLIGRVNNHTRLILYHIIIFQLYYPIIKRKVVMTMNFNENNREITEQYKELKEYNKILREEERNKKIRDRNKKLLIKNGVILLIFLLIFIFVIHPLFKIMRDFIKENLTYNVMDKIDFRFNGKFEILSPTIDVNQDVMPDGYYTVRDQNGIVFKIRKRKTQISTDYDYYLYRMYVLDYINKNSVDNIIYESKEHDMDSNSFFSFTYGIRLDSYANIDQEINDKVLSLIKYMEKRAKKDFDFEAIGFKTNVYLNDFSVPIYYYEYNLLGKETVFNKIKVEYINYLIDNNITDNDVTKDDIQKYYKPSELKIFINDMPSKHISINSEYDDYVHFDYNRMDYRVNLYKILKSLDNIECTTNKITGYLIDFNYNGSTYYLDGDLYLERKGNRFSYTWTMTMLEDFFGAEIVYDYDNKTVNIIILNKN